jgi:chemotaxis signal transduction protein
MVDIAREVVEISDSEIQDAPEFENLKTSAPIVGLVNDQGDITMIMDITKVFSVNEVIELNTNLN